MIGIVDDNKAYREGLQSACQSRNLECKTWKTLAEAKKSLFKTAPPKLDLLLIDCCLRPHDQGKSADGVRLAEELCRLDSFKGVPIYMHTRFRDPDTVVGQTLQQLLDSHKARDARDVHKDKRIINPSLDSCVADVDTTEQLRRVLERAREIGVPILD
jgi:DNA-binding NtrC family response regulator